jgi:ubiquinone/menaquinone biosynthesis C-methylase UbiE
MDVVDLGAGTGRFANLLAPKARSVILVDGSRHMLDSAAAKMNRVGHSNWTVRVSDICQVPLPDGSADLIVSGWSICYVASTNRENHREALSSVVGEMERILRPGGRAIIFETLGTGNTEPRPPDALVPYYTALESEYGFRHRWIRTDYRFASREEARDLSEFFFGSEMPSRLTGPGGSDLPECTGVWWRVFRDERGDTPG